MYQKDKKAFTIYELILVIILMGILAVIGILRISLNSNTKFLFNVNNFYSNLLLAKKTALNFNTYNEKQKDWYKKAVCVKIENNEYSIFINQLNAFGNVIGTIYLKNEKGLPIKNISYENVKISSPEKVFCFDYEGKIFKDDISPQNLLKKDMNITLSNGTKEKHILISGYIGNIFEE